MQKIEYKMTIFGTTKKTSDEDAWTSERVRRNIVGAFWLNKSRINIK